MSLIITRHARETVTSKGFDMDTIARVHASPTEVYPSGSHPGQHRMTGHGLCLVGRFDGDDFVLITVYLDRIVTAPRPDQTDYSQRVSQARAFRPVGASIGNR
jgi:hypothetical protein